MAFPYIFESNFEQGTNGEWDSESDTGSLLDFPHYSTLSRVQNAPIPYRGAYCMRIQLGDTNDHTLTEGDIDIADAATRYFRWYMFAASDLTASADDTFQIFELQQAGGATTEMSVGLRITAATNALDIWVGDGKTPSGTYITFPRNKWVCVELLATVSTGGAGVMTLFLDELQVVTQTGTTQAAAVGTGAFGTQDTLATTTGGLYFDQFIMDDGRIFGFPIRYPEETLVTKTQHVFVGQGVVDAALLSGSSTDSVLQIFDTDQNNTNHTGRMKLELKGVAASTYVDSHFAPVHVQRGCYVVLSGTAPRALVKIEKAQGYFSQGRIRQHGNAWVNTPGSW